VAELDGRIVGYTYSAPHSDRASYRWTVNIGVFVHDSAHRRGVARALYDALLPCLRRHGFFNAIAGITIGNDASVRFHEGLGFKQAALYKSMGYKVGAWHDVGWWQLPLQPYVDNPPFPKP
jgi:phosphinothricin acetyltransferase